ncbi:F-box protein At5g07610 [Euphorbia lathyris]|uniref:F-box protein At5g07610 n=1 Tax=Euphorbia lathyris TaxID=212925 RepID=UPI003313ED4C
MAFTQRFKTILPPSLSAEKIASHDDLLLQILVRLPIKSLLKFKSVSKHWLSLITNPHFSRRGYLSHCGLFLDTWSRATYQFDFIDLHCNHSDPPLKTLTCVDYPPEMKIIQSCNGLLLCCSIPSSKSATNYYVCNPTTKQHSVIPPLTPVGEISGPFLAFDPLKSPDYKVICIHQFQIEEPNYQIEIYSSKSGKWRLSEASFRLDFDIGMHGGVFWNGGIHWYTDSGPCLYFDVDEEEIKEMAMPSPIPDDWYRRRVRYFGESRGHLQLIEIYHPPSTQFDVWEMENDRSGWSVKYRVNLDGIVSGFPGMIRSYIDPSELNYYVFEILCIVEGEREDDSYMVLHIPANIIRYDLKTRSFKKLCDFPPAGLSDSDHRREDAASFYYSNAHPYIESLVSLAKRRNGGPSEISARILTDRRMGEFWIQPKNWGSSRRRNRTKNLRKSSEDDALATGAQLA